MTTDIENQNATPVQLCILYVETEGSPFADKISLRAEKQYAAITVAMSRMVMFLTNVNTITEEAETELVKELKLAGRDDLAEAIAIGGFAAAVGIVADFAQMLESVK